MAADNIMVRIAVTGGTEFRNELTRSADTADKAARELERSQKRAAAAATVAAQQVARDQRQMGYALQNLSFQTTDFFVQIASGTSAMRAFAQQAPQFLGVFGPGGAILGTVVGVGAALVSVFSDAGDAAAAASSQFEDLRGSAEAVNGAISAVRDVQQSYVEAINAQSGASAAAASAVIANSQAEFAARKEVLAVELELLRLRGAERAAAIDNLQSQANAALGARMGDLAQLAGIRANDPRYARDYGNPLAPPSMGLATEALGRVTDERTVLAIRKLKAEAELDRLALERGQALLNTEFADLNTGGGAAGGGGQRGRGGGGGGGTNEALREGKRLFEQTRTAAERYSAELARLQELHRQGAIDAETFERAQADLESRYVASAQFMGQVAGQVKTALGSLFEGIVEGGKSAGEVIEDLAKKLASMALQTSAFNLLAGLAPGIFGAGGTIPLVASARGNAFSAGEVMALAQGGVVTGPTMFPLRRGLGLMGEAGPEAVLPLARGADGSLGVRGGGGGTTIIVQNYSGGSVRQETARGPDGREVVKVIVAEEMARGAFDRPLRGRYGQSPDKVTR